MKRNVLAAAVAIAATALLAGATSFAQGPAPGAPTAPPPGATAGGPPPPPPTGASERATHPVLRITSVEIIRSTRQPYLDIVRVRGLASSGGWEEAELVPLTRGNPPDGVLHLALVARPPETAADASGFEPIEAIFPLEPAHPYKGVNVRSASNAVAVTGMPGYAEGTAIADCGTCVGKTLVARGAAAPAGADVVREEQLPATVRVLRPTDGLTAMDSNPNRLTLLVNEQGRIVAAVWE